MHYRLSLTLLMASLPFLLFFQFFLLWTCIWLQFSWETALFSCTREFKADPPKINYLILRTSIEDGSINNQSAYLTKNSKTKYPCLLHLDHPPHGVFRFVAALPSPKKEERGENQSPLPVLIKRKCMYVGFMSLEAINKSIEYTSKILLYGYTGI